MHVGWCRKAVDRIAHDRSLNNTARTEIVANWLSQRWFSVLVTLNVGAGSWESCAAVSWM